MSAGAVAAGFVGGMSTMVCETADQVRDIRAGIFWSARHEGESFVN